MGLAALLWVMVPFEGTNSFIFWGVQGGPQVTSRGPTTPLKKGVKNPVTDLFSAIYRGYSSNLQGVMTPATYLYCKAIYTDYVMYAHIWAMKNILFVYGIYGICVDLLPKYL